MASQRSDRRAGNRAAFEAARQKILKTQTVCGICGKPVDFSYRYPHPLSPTVDHIIPVSKGGHPSDSNNLQLAHRCCNRQKSDKLTLETKQNTKILLVKNNNGRYWSFPKGHIEEGETEQETAIREIKEETGLDVTIVRNFREISEYCPFGKIRKRVVFFLARAFTDNVKIQEEEIDSYIWVDLQQARKLCTYDNDLRIIEKAETTIHLMRN